ncbi:MAG TPA: 4-hydroxy-tetrahydrodipicolinate synthase [Candidatus Acidoferrales bacterium]|nr:4-hydroxy-tetrahydrodipicolinate synthase [Candidatus Acidoferrales bacterium]
MNAPEWLRGSMPPLVTPFVDGRIDTEAYARLVELQISGGSHGVVVNGTTSEPSTLTVDERNALIDVAVRTANRRIPIVAATGSQSLAETMTLTQHAVRAGVDALLIVTPYYIRPPQRGLVEYYASLTRGLRIPWMIYHIPGRTAVNVEVETARKLAELSPAFVGMKHASTDLAYVSELLATLPDLRIFVGLEELSFPMMALGAVGLMNAVGNLNPRVLVEMCEAVWSGDLRRGRALHEQLLELNKAVFFDTNPIPIKYMMKRLGILPRNEHRLPMVPATPELERKLDRVLERAGMLAETAKTA